MGARRHAQAAGVPKKSKANLKRQLVSLSLPSFAIWRLGPGQEALKESALEAVEAGAEGPLDLLALLGYALR